MTQDWAFQAVNALILVAFGCVLMWRTRVAVRAREARLWPSEPDARQERIARLRAEITRLQLELDGLEGRASPPEVSTVA